MDIYLDKVAFAHAIHDAKALVAAMKANSERLHGIQKGLEAVLQGAMGDAYTVVMNGYNRDLSAYDSQIKNLNDAADIAAHELGQVDEAGAAALGTARG